MTRARLWALFAVATAIPGSVAAQSSVGMIVGEPTGVSVRVGTVQAHAAWSFRDDGALHLSADKVLRFGNMETGLVWYVGLGARAKFADDVRIGPRVPVGFLYPDAGPFEVFVEVAPILDLTPETTLRVNGGIGLRYVIGRR